MAGEAKTQPADSKPGGPTCPLCDEPLAANWQGRLYGVIVCETCRRAFARRRIWAYVVDLTLLIAVMWAIQLVVRPIGSPTLGRTWDHTVGFLFASMLFRDALGGQSPGKRLFDLQATHRATGTGIGFGASALRNLPLLPFWFAPFALYALAELEFGPRIGDGLAKTKVIWKRHRDKVPFLPPRGYCYQCGYDMTGNVSGKCPECGTPSLQPPTPAIEGRL
ncbi:MAG: RDD family protein [Phycisphaerales bacterium]|nr:RDD family protein [Phycisphaerales bacterium]